MDKKRLGRKFKQLIILDPIILSSSQWNSLSNFTESVYLVFHNNKDYQQINKDNNEMQNFTLVNKLDYQRIDNILKECDAIISCWTSIPDELILSNPNLIYIGFWTHCKDYKISMKLANHKGIIVTYIPDYGTDAVAEMTIAGILTIYRKIQKNARDTLRGKWQYEYLKTGDHIPNIEEIPAKSISGKILGIVGFGRIGKRVAEIAQALKMIVQYYSTTRHLDWESKGIKRLDIDNLFSTSDIISIHLPQSAPSQIINRDLIKKMKDQSIFINTSAGRLVDQEALFDEIKSKRIYAYLDVYEGLPPKKLFKEVNTLDNLFTYRAAWFTREAVFLKGESLLRNMDNFFSKE